MATLREASKKDFLEPKEDAENAENDNCDIDTGSLQRIADATEAMAKNHKDLIREKEMYERWWLFEEKKTHHLRAVIRGLKGRVTILNRKITAP